MKKLAIVLGVSLLCLTGCGSKTKTMTCTRTLNQNGVEVDLRYEVEYAKDTVNVVKSVEKVTSEDSEVLDNFKETIEAMYEPYKGIKHWNTEVKIDGNTLTSTVTIDYSKVDINKILEIDFTAEAFIKDGKIKLNDIQTVYEESGATCEK